MVHDEAEREQYPPLENPWSHGRVTNRTEQDGVVAAQFLHHRIRQQLAGRVVATRTKVVFGRLDGDLS